MADLHSRLFGRIMSRNREVYLLKVITLAIAFASSVLIALFSLNEFNYDRFHDHSDNVFRVLQRNISEPFSGNRLSAVVPREIFSQLNSKPYSDPVIVSRVKIMNKVMVLSDHRLFEDQKIHAADPRIVNILSFDILNGNANDFKESDEVKVMLSSSAAQKYTGTIQASGKKLKLYTFQDTVDVKIAAVYNDFPFNSHETFDVFIMMNAETVTALNFNPDESGIYGRALQFTPKHYAFTERNASTPSKMGYRFQPLPEIYFGPRVVGEEAKHGDRYSVIILTCIASLILFLSLSSFINLTSITLPYRSKELAIKKLAGTSQWKLVLDFLKESSTLVGISFLIGIFILISTNSFTESILNLNLYSSILNFDYRLLLIILFLFVLLAVSPVFMTIRFVKASPNRLLRTDTITFPRLKRMITFFQLGISIFLIIAAVVVRRQINYSLVKEPGQNHDQVVYLHFPSGLTNQGINSLRTGWKKYNPNILDVMAVSQLPNHIISKEIGSPFYLLQVDPGFKDFFEFDMLDGFWFGPNASDSSIVINQRGKALAGNERNEIGVINDFNGLFNQPEKPVKIKLAKDYNYNWLCIRVLEVDIRRTVNFLSEQFARDGKKAEVNYLDEHFKYWIDYQDRLNRLSELLAIISGVLSCFAIYGLSLSLVRDKMKEIAIHQLFGAHSLHITYLLARDFVKQMLLALLIFGPLAYILLNELLRTFVFSTKFSWLDPVYPIAYCVVVIIVICTFQALSLNRSGFVSALKS